MRNKTNASRLRGRASLLPILIVLLAALILAGCGGTAAPEETPAPVYALRYYLGDKLLQTQSLAEGEYPTHLDLSFPGLTFAGWRTDGGAPVQPEQTPITGDVDYHAVIYPLLTNHVPYLFPDEDGFLHPDAPLTMQALDAAIRALAAPEAVGYLPALPAAEEPITPDKLSETLRTFFPAPQVDAAMAVYRGNDVIARRDAAASLRAFVVVRYCSASGAAAMLSMISVIISGVTSTMPSRSARGATSVFSAGSSLASNSFASWSPKAVTVKASSATANSMRTWLSGDQRSVAVAISMQ